MKSFTTPATVVDLDAYRAAHREREAVEVRGRLLYADLLAEARILLGTGAGEALIRCGTCRAPMYASQRGCGLCAWDALPEADE
jgi:hypothetical protein